jgi:hypothetical protein
MTVKELINKKIKKREMEKQKSASELRDRFLKDLKQYGQEFAEDVLNYVEYIDDHIYINIPKCRKISVDCILGELKYTYYPFSIWLTNLENAIIPI